MLLSLIPRLYESLGVRRVKRGPFSNCVDINTKLVN